MSVRSIWIVIREELSALVEVVDSMGNRMEGCFKQMDERFDKLEGRRALEARRLGPFCMVIHHGPPSVCTCTMLHS